MQEAQTQVVAAIRENIQVSGVLSGCHALVDIVRVKVRRGAAISAPTPTGVLGTYLHQSAHVASDVRTGTKVAVVSLDSEGGKVPVDLLRSTANKAFDLVPLAS